MAFTKLKNCLACNSKKLSQVLDLNQQPLANSYLKNYKTKEKKYDLKVNGCSNCTHLQLSVAVDPNKIYKKYDYVSGTTQTYKNFMKKFGESNTLIVSADIENQINGLKLDEKKKYMEMIGLKETGLNMLIQKGYKILELDTYFTSGPEETRAWTIQKNCTAPKAAGEIHTDFEKGFIRAETVSYEDFVDNHGWVNSKTNGKMRLEGKDYIVKDGDVLNFRFNT